MTPTHDFEVDKQLDRLVDGELSREEYRELLSRLDDAPDGWRRCSMAFLEAQAFGREFGKLRDSIESSHSATSCHRIDRHVDHRRVTRLAERLTGIAVTIAIGFVVGMWWQSSYASKQELIVPNLVHETDGLPALSSLDEAKNIASEIPSAGSTPAEHLTFVVDGADGESDRFELPIYDASDHIARQLLNDNSSLPAEVERQIRNSGFEVKSQREWTQVRLRDGRRAFFPVDQLEITPVSRLTYQ